MDGSTPRYDLRLLGAPQLRRDGVPVVFETPEALALLAYLTLEARPCPRQALAALFWPDLAPEVAHTKLRDTLRPLQAVLADRLVVTPGSVAAQWAAADTLDIRRAQADGSGAGELLAGLPSVGDPFEAWLGEQRALLASSPQHEPSASERPAGLVGGALVGRGAEFGRLRAVYGLAAGGTPQAALLSGEPGIGKTRLAGALLDWAQARGAKLLRGRALEGAGTPFAALVEALRREREALRARLNPAQLADLARLLPELDAAPAPPADRALRPLLLEALDTALTVLVPPPEAGVPLLLLLDDLHWADEGSLEALTQLATRLTETPLPVLLVFTARAEHLTTGAPLHAWLARLRRLLPLHETALGPLDAHDTRQLLAAALPDAPEAVMDRLGAWLFGETGGQPLYLTETLRSLLESGALSPGADGPQLDETRLPTSVEGVRAAIGERLSRLGPATLALAQAAAVLGGEASFELLRAVADLDGDAALAGYEELLRSGLLLELPDGDEPRATLSHDRVRETLAGELSRPRRQLLHRRALEALAKRSTPAATLAGHAAQAGQSAEAAALYEQAAVAANEMGAFDTALGALERALSLTPARADTGAARLRLLVTITVTLFKRDAGLSPALLARLQGAAQAAQAAGVPAEQAAALNLLAADLIHAGRLDEAETNAQAALVAARSASSKRDEARALLGLARVETLRWNWNRASAHAERALQLADTLGPLHEDTAIYATLALAVIRRWGHGALRQARAQLASLLNRARRFCAEATVQPPDQDHVLHRVLWELVWHDALVGDYDEALAHLRELEALGGRPPEVVLAMRGLLQLRRDDLPAALTASGAAVEISERFGLKFPNVYGIRALCLLRGDQPDEARRALTLGQAASAQYNHVRDRADSALRFGEVLLALGDPDAAQQEYAWALGTTSLPHVLGALRGLGSVLAARGDAPGAALCLGAVLSHGAVGVAEKQQAETTLAGLRAHFPATVLDAALAEGARTPIRARVQRVQADLAFQARAP